MNRARLRYADGREEVCEVADPIVTVIQRRDADGVTRMFVETNEIDDEGCDIYVEEAEQ